MSTEIIMKLLGERIRARRLTLGLSIDDVAKRSASSIDFIKELEWSMLSDIELTKLQSIAEAMEQSVSDLVIDRSTEDLLDQSFPKSFS
ncbi:MAG: hypothetical protein JST89_16675 [Cyanobacteria bacterium SZAS-4]|nr:hypothetical protein [Cyanobacteria bacterium SZAS-4]